MPSTRHMCQTVDPYLPSPTTSKHRLALLLPHLAKPLGAERHGVLVQHHRHQLVGHEGFNDELLGRRRGRQVNGHWIAFLVDPAFVQRADGLAVHLDHGVLHDPRFAARGEAAEQYAGAVFRAVDQGVVDHRVFVHTLAIAEHHGAVRASQAEIGAEHVAMAGDPQPCRDVFARALFEVDQAVRLGVGADRREQQRGRQADEFFQGRWVKHRVVLLV